MLCLHFVDTIINVAFVILVCNSSASIKEISSKITTINLTL